MLLDFNEIYHKYNLNIKGVIHIGAHFGQEHRLYVEKQIKNIIYFEPLSNNYSRLVENVGVSAKTYKMALGSEEKEIDMFVESNNMGMSSSILKPKHHLIQYPHITFDKTEKVLMDRLDNIDFDRESFNFINIDVQGYELEVFKGAVETLEKIDYIISEINNTDLYENGAMIQDLCDFLGKFGFVLVEQNWVGQTWGDGFFIKNKK
jgi:FkbM family methyltransferase